MPSDIISLNGKGAPERRPLFYYLEPIIIYNITILLSILFILFSFHANEIAEVIELGYNRRITFSAKRVVAPVLINLHLVGR